jgi:hypothetical protein
MFDCVFAAYVGLDLLPGNFGEFALVINIEKLFSLGGAQVEAVIPDKFEGIPGHGVMSRSDRNATLRPKPLDG